MDARRVASVLAMAAWIPLRAGAQGVEPTPDLYRLPFVIPGGVVEKELPKDLEHWIPKGIALRFGDHHLLFDPEVCAVRGWWRSGDERLKKMNWGSRVVYIPEGATQAPEPDGARFEWGPRDRRGAPAPARWGGYRTEPGGRIEFRWTAGGGDGLDAPDGPEMRVTETFERRDGTRGGLALAGVRRTIRAEADAPRPGPAAVGGRFRHPVKVAIPVRIDGAVRSLADGNGSLAVGREARVVLGTAAAPVALEFRAAGGGGGELSVSRPPGVPDAVDIRWRSGGEAAGRSIGVELEYLRAPAGTALERLAGVE